MRKINSLKIKETITTLLKEAAYDLPKEVESAMKKSYKKSNLSKLEKNILKELIDNINIAREEKMPLCQDTGTATIFIEIGQDVHITGDFYKAINDGAVEAYKNLRKSIVGHPLTRENTKDNAPVNLHMNIIPGDKIKITVLPKGGGAENASLLKMLLPTSSEEDIIDAIVTHVKENGTKACPPLIIGIGLGGTFDNVATLAKKALLRPIESFNKDKKIAKIEKILLKKINGTNVGPMGVGGETTALAIHIETAPCHIASLPLAINLQCHSHRHKEATI
ncbi:fumarate hydratase [candidate division WOR-1 bacterium RIFOXYA2_FULL_36_21]|uniref:Fumarate hydratase n=1 Tax=candidate division WOR-1 bacterium RIFOXYB2_FULL_36_35 TaxID=1802578 RepID=A0A1F4S4T8_UNCSA|nr:MAG: fumarate hydratase [candidate division WOR-1 bacterium RIFOXYA2_FULL_36_21]OGC14753.1 MAG: fumarate hydratase [candidate division WOR-1 bacterium RIFOXYB2_FULL_36_35]OGC15463.1 MAG: fumarate hydratase [candidate division WOR-1 bacterium RIFOXYA12_FULL_36_13]